MVYRPIHSLFSYAQDVASNILPIIPPSQATPSNDPTSFHPLEQQTDSNQIESNCCDKCLHEADHIELAVGFCHTCKLGLCSDHLGLHRKHFGGSAEHMSSIQLINLQPTTSTSQNTEIMAIQQQDSKLGFEQLVVDHNDEDFGEIEIVSSQPIHEFEHHESMSTSTRSQETMTTFHNVTEEEELLIALNKQDIILWNEFISRHPQHANLTPTVFMRKFYHAGLTGSLVIENNTNHTIHCILSQVGPLHEILLPPHRMGLIEGIGRVHFTIEVGIFDPLVDKDKLLSGWDKALPIIGSVCGGIGVGVGVVAAAFTGIGVLGLGVGAVAVGSSGVASVAVPVVASGVAAGIDKKKHGNNGETGQGPPGVEQRELMESTMGTTLNGEVEEETQQQFTLVDDALPEQQTTTEPTQVINMMESVTTTISESDGRRSIDSQTETTSSPSTSSAKGFGYWMKKAIPGTNWTYPNCYKRGVLADGRGLVVNEDDFNSTLTIRKI